MRSNAWNACVVFALLAGCATVEKLPPVQPAPVQEEMAAADNAAMDGASPSEETMVSKTAPAGGEKLEPAPAAAAAADSMLFTPIVESGVILYEKPRNKSAVVGLVEMRANVTATGEEENGYMRVEASGISGWVDKQLLQKSGSQSPGLLAEAPRKLVQKTPRPRTALMRTMPPRQSGAVAEGTGDGRVVLYSASWCPYCDKARAFMQNRGVAFEEYDTETHPKGRRDYAAMNGNGIPILLVGNHKIVGWKQAEFERHYAGGQAQPEPQQAAAPQPEIRAVPAPPVQVAAVVAKPVQAVAAEGGQAYVPKVASGVVLYSQPTNTSKVGGLLKGAEQVLALGEEQNGYMRVQGATGEGWVDKTLMRKL